MNLFNPVQQQQPQPFPQNNNNFQLPFNQSGTNQFNSATSPTFPFTNQSLGPNSAGPSTGTGGSFGNTNLTGNNSLFPQGGNNNLFNANAGAGGQNPQAGNAWNNNQPNTNNNLFRSVTPNNNAGGAPNMFQTNNNAGTNNNNNLFRSNTMMNSTTPNTNQPASFLNPNNTLGNTGNNNSFNNNLFTVNNDANSRSHGYNTRGSVLPPFGDKGTVNIKYMPRRNMENLLICSITSAKECKDKSLEELRAEDYQIIKAGQLPDSIKQAIQKNAQMADGLNASVPSSLMIGSSNNNATGNTNMFSNSSGNMGNNNSMGGGNSMMNTSTPNNPFGNNTSNLQRPGTGWPSVNNTNSNPFQPQNTLPAFGNNNMGNNNNTQNTFFGQQPQNQNANTGFFGGNNNQSNPSVNPFGNNNAMNQQSGNNNLFQGPNKFQPQGPTLSLNNPNQPNNPFGNNNNNGMGGSGGGNPFQTRPGPSFLPTNQQQQGGMQMQMQNNPFPIRNTNSAFPNQLQFGSGQQQQQQGGPSFLPQQNPMQPGAGFMPNNNNGMQGTNPQVFSLTGSNPHLFPQNPQMGSAFPGQNPQFNNPFNNNNQMFPQQGGQMQMPGQDPMGNPHLFPYQQGQMPYMNFNTQAGNYLYPGAGNPNMYAGGGGYPMLNFDKFQNSMMTPYGEDPNRSNYLPRNTLNDVASNLENRFSSERNSPESSSSYLPYNPFKRRTNRLMDITNRENIMREPTTFSHKYQGSSMIRKPDDAFTFIKKSKYTEDDVEIFMKPKLNITNNRNRSWSPSRRERSLSPAYSRERDSYVEAPVRHMAKSIYNSTIRVNAMIQIDSQTRKEICVQIFEKSTVADLKAKILEGLKYLNILRPEIFEEITLLDQVTERSDLYHHKKLATNQVHLDEMRLQDGSTVELRIPREYEKQPDSIKNNTSGRSRGYEPHHVQVSAFSMMEGELIKESSHPPKLTNPEYSTKPTIQELSRMSDEELAMVDGFSMWNKDGKIEFMGRVDLRGVDLDQVVSIGHRLVEVYPERNFPNEESKPVKGEKLNRPAIISLYNCFPVNFKSESNDPEERRQELIKKYERQAHRNGYEFVDYDYENGVYRIRVKNF